MSGARLLSGCVLCACVLVAPAVALAQASDPGPVADVRAAAASPLPAALADQEADRSAANPDLRLDIRAPADLGLWGESRFRLARVELLGVTVLDRTDTEPLLAPYRDRMVTMGELQALREALSRLYLERGYVSSGVIIPDQEIIDGVVRLQAIEGRLTAVAVQTDRRLRPSYVSDRVQRRIEGPLDLDTLQDALVALQNDARIERVDAELAPGEQRGDSRLQLRVTEAKPWTVGLAFDNHRAESIGAERARLQVTHGNVSGVGDALALSLDVTDGSNTGAVSYTRPLAADDSALSLYASLDDSSVLEAPFSALDIESVSDTFGVRMTTPLYETLRSEVGLSIGFERRTTVTRVLGRRFSLSPGAIDGESSVSALNVGLDYVVRGEAQVLALRGTLRHGLDLFDATDADDADGALLDADGQFTLALLQGQYVRQLTPALRFVARLSAQLTDNALLSSEKVSIGGVDTVRGYRENLLVRDSGVAATLQLTGRPFVEAGQPWLRDLGIALFLDHGMAWDEQDTAPGSRLRDTDASNRITGAGFGLVWTPFAGLSLEAWKGFDIADDFASGEDPRDGGSRSGLQNEGVHLSLSWQRSF